MGESVAYVSPVRSGDRRPAIIWLAGGFDWRVDEGFWQPAPRANDQTARAFREGGVVLMLPALRGSNLNPGRNECFLGEVDDVLAAAEALAQRPDVDPQRMYLGGHSTGATLALLVAESTARFRAVFAFGPVADPRQYGDAGCLPESASEAEIRPRVPIEHLSEIRTPTFIIEGAAGNADVLPAFEAARRTAPIRVVRVPGADHFSVLAPGTEAVTGAIVAATNGRGLTIEVADILKRMRVRR